MQEIFNVLRIYNVRTLQRERIILFIIFNILRRAPIRITIMLILLSRAVTVVVVVDVAVDSVVDVAFDDFVVC